MMNLGRNRHRVSGGAIQAWEAALGRAWEFRRPLAGAAAVLLAVIVVLHVFPGVPAYQRGFLTGVLLTVAAWQFSWLIWVSSGLSLRLNGVWAEQRIAEELRNSGRVFGTVRSFKTDGQDIDIVAITRQGVLVVEVKWSLGSSWERTIDRAAHQAGQMCGTLGKQIHVDGLTTESFIPIVIYCGREAGKLEPRLHPVQRGSTTSVLVLGETHLDEWMSGQKGGYMSTEFAATILTEIESVADVREQANVDASWMLRRLARAK